MGKAPAFPLYASDFDMDTATWENYEIGIYFRLLLYEWVNGGIPNDLESIARIVREPIAKPNNKRFSEKFKRNLCEFEEKLKRNVREKFTENGKGLLVNSRMENIRQEKAYYIESQREKGIKSARKRWKGHITRVTTTVKKRLQPEDNLSSSSSSSSSKKNKESISHSEVKKFLTHYGERFKFHFGTEPVIEWGKDGTLIKNLFKTISFENLKELLEAFFCSEDRFIQKSGYTMGIFKSQINKLKIGNSHKDGMDLWLKVKEEQDERRKQKKIQLINEEIKGDISNEPER